jgi:hypothetical protein
MRPASQSLGQSGAPWRISATVIFCVTGSSARSLDPYGRVDRKHVAPMLMQSFL